MQSESTDPSHAGTDPLIKQPSQSPQHGLYAEDPGLALSAGPYTEQSGAALSTASAITFQHVFDEEEGLSDKLLCMNGVPEGEHRLQPSADVVSDCENDYTPGSPKNQAEGPAFEVVRSGTNRHDGPRLDEFPNGNTKTYRFRGTS